MPNDVDPQELDCVQVAMPSEVLPRPPCALIRITACARSRPPLPSIFYLVQGARADRSRCYIDVQAITGSP